jgi:hypothetical protein
MSSVLAQNVFLPETTFREQLRTAELSYTGVSISPFANMFCSEDVIFCEQLRAAELGYSGGGDAE